MEENTTKLFRDRRKGELNIKENMNNDMQVLVRSVASRLHGEIIKLVGKGKHNNKMFGTLWSKRGKKLTFTEH